MWLTAVITTCWLDSARCTLDLTLLLYLICFGFWFGRKGESSRREVCGVWLWIFIVFFTHCSFYFLSKSLLHVAQWHFKEKKPFVSGWITTFQDDSALFHRILWVTEQFNKFENKVNPILQLSQPLPLQTISSIMGDVVLFC